MADRTPAFNPPPAKAPDSDKMINRIDLKEVEWTNRSSQQKPWAGKAGINHVKNGG